MENTTKEGKSSEQVASGSVPVGSLIAWAILTGTPLNESKCIDTNIWAYCDGSATTVNYEDGTNDSINLPDLTDGRFLRGFSSYGVGGQDSFTISEGNLPTHTHGVGTLSIGLSGALTHTHNVSGNVNNTNLAHYHHTLVSASTTTRVVTGSTDSAFREGQHGGNLSNPGSYSILTDSSGSPLGANTGISGRAVNSSGVNIEGTMDHGHSFSVTSSNGSSDLDHSHSLTGSTGSVGSGSSITHIPKYFNVKYFMRIK